MTYGQLPFPAAFPPFLRREEGRFLIKSRSIQCFALDSPAKPRREPLFGFQSSWSGLFSASPPIPGVRRTKEGQY